MLVNFGLYVTLLLLQCTDAFTTYKVLSAGGRETNPAGVFLQKHLPGKWTWLVVMKLPLVVLAVALVFLGTFGTVMLAMLDLSFAYVTWHNYREWKH